MKQSNNRIIFFGSSKFVVPILEVLRKNFEIALVITTDQPSLPRSAIARLRDGEKLRPARKTVPDYCITHQIPYLSIKQFNNATIEQLKTTCAPFALLAYFGLIIPHKILNLFPKGILNIHPSLLPKYRGPTPVQTAILNGDKKTGVTLIRLDKEVDHGPILAQVEEEISPTDTAETLYERLFKIGAELLSQNINQYIEGEIKLSPQDHSKATFTRRLTRQDGYIDLQNPPQPEILDRMIRSYYPWPGVWTRLRLGFGGQAKLRIVKFLPGKKIQVEGRKPMTYRDFKNGYPEAKEIISLLS